MYDALVWDHFISNFLYSCHVYMWRGVFTQKESMAVDIIHLHRGSATVFSGHGHMSNFETWIQMCYLNYALAYLQALFILLSPSCFEAPSSILPWRSISLHILPLWSSHLVQSLGEANAILPALMAFQILVLLSIIFTALFIAYISLSPDFLFHVKSFITIKFPGEFLIRDFNCFNERLYQQREIRDLSQKTVPEVVTSCFIVKFKLSSLSIQMCMRWSQAGTAKILPI